MRNRDYLAESIDWERSTEPLVPFKALHEGKALSIRLNNFPEAHLYTLIAGRSEVSFDDWPETWTKRSAASKARFAAAATKRTTTTNGQSKTAPAKKASASRAHAATAKSRSSASSRAKSKTVRS